MRLVGRPIEVYNYLEPLYNDYRKLRMQNQDGGYALSHVDEVIDQMLTQEYLFDIALPRLPHRYVGASWCYMLSLCEGIYNGVRLCQGRHQHIKHTQA